MMMILMMIMGIIVIAKNGHDDNRHDNNHLKWIHTATVGHNRDQVSGTHHVTFPTPVEARM